MTERIVKKLVFRLIFVVFFITLDIEKQALANRIGSLRVLKFTIEPQDAIAVPGSDVKLECTARHINKKQPHYKWILNGTELAFEKKPSRQLPFVYNVSSHDGSLSIQNIHSTAYGVYQCVADVMGLAIISRKTFVRMPYLYQTSDHVPTNITCSETRPCVIIPPHVASFPAPTHIWEFRRNRNEAFRVTGNSSRELLGGRSRFVVSLEGMLCNINVSKIDEGEYRCRVVNGYRTLLSNVYHVRVEDANVSRGFPYDKSKSEISVLVEPRNMTVGVTLTASFDCIVSGRNVTINWWKEDRDNLINANYTYKILSGYRLNIRNTKNDDKGWYGCLAVSGLNSVVKKAYLKVREPVDLVTHWSRSLTIVAGGDLILRSTVYHGKVKWYKDGVPIDHRFLTSCKSVPSTTRKTTKIRDEIVKDECILRLKDVRSNDSGIYQALAEGFETQESDNTNVIVYGCGSLIQREYGFITSPQFPDFYPENIQCLWIIKSGRNNQGSKFHLSFNTFDIGGCSDDYLGIQDGKSEHSNMISYDPLTIITSGLSAFRLTFKSHACPNKSRHRGFNATYWVTEPTQTPTTKLQPSLTTATGHKTNGPNSSTRETKTAEPTKTPTTQSQLSSTIVTGYETKEPRISTSTGRTKTEKITRENGTEAPENASSSMDRRIAYGSTAAGVCLLLIFGICLLLVKRTRNTSIEQETGVEETTQSIDVEAIGCSSEMHDSEVSQHHLYATADQDESAVYSASVKTNLKQPEKSTSDPKETPVYDILEAPYATADEITPRDWDSFTMSNDIYSTINDGYDADDDCSGDMPRRPLDSRVCETSFSEDVYSSLNPERELDNNIYESLRRLAKNGDAAGEVDKLNQKHERDVLASLPGIDSAELDYVILC